jgi:L-ascorbate metabolism protein UlaG (beta-lactamase superfamily)
VNLPGEIAKENCRAFQHADEDDRFSGEITRDVGPYGGHAICDLLARYENPGFCHGAFILPVSCASARNFVIYWWCLPVISHAIKIKIFMYLNGTKLTWLGHAAFRVETPGGKTVLIDPWLKGNPACPESEKEVKKVDVMLCSHGHSDHIGDAVEIAKKHNPVVVGMVELCAWLQSKGVKQASGMNKGGTANILDLKITMVHASHSSGIQDGDRLIYGGEPAGFVMEFSNGLKIYHAGDTCVFGDMAIIGELYKPDIAMLPIGDYYTMSPREAAYACSLLKPKTVIPMHFGTFPILTGTVAEFRKLVKDAEVFEMKPGVTVS